MEGRDVTEDGRVGSSRISPSTKTTIELVRSIRINYFKKIGLVVYLQHTGQLTKKEKDE